MSSVFPLVAYQKFANFKADGIRLRFTPLGNAFWRGMIAVSSGEITHLATGALNPTGFSCLPTTLIDLSTTTATEVTIPWTHFTAKCPTYQVSPQSQVVIWVIAPAACDSTPGQTQNFPFQLEASFINPDLLDPDNSAPVIPAVIPRTGFTTPTMSPAYVQSRTVPLEAKEKAKQGTISSTLNSAAHIAGVAKAIPVISPIASGLELALSGASKIAELFGFSKPPNLGIPVYSNNITFPGYQQYDGVVTGQVMSAAQVPFVATDPALQRAEWDYTDLHQLAKQQTIVTAFLSGSAPGLVGTLKVWPFYCSALGTNLTLPPLAYAAHMGLYWTGDLAYKIIIPASNVTRARFAITYSPNALTAFSEDVRYQFVDVQGTTTVDFIIPYMGTTPYKRRPVTNANGDDFMNGYLQIWLVSTPISQVPGETPTALTVAVFCGGTDNFNVAVVNSQDLTFDPPSRDAPTAQGFVGLTETVEFDHLLPDDDILSMRARLHRPNVYPTTLALTASATTGLQLNSLYSAEIAAFLTRFKSWRGSITLYLSVLPSVATDIKITYSIDGRHTAEVVWRTAREPTMALTLPLAQMRGLLVAQNNTLGFFNCSVQFSPSADCSISIRQALCDDLSVGVIRHPLTSKLR